MDTTSDAGEEPEGVSEVLAENLSPRAEVRHKVELEPKVKENLEVLSWCGFGPKEPTIQRLANHFNEMGGLGRQVLIQTPIMLGNLPSNKMSLSVILDEGLRDGERRKLRMIPLQAHAKGSTAERRHYGGTWPSNGASRRPQVAMTLLQVLTMLISQGRRHEPMLNNT